MQLTVDPKKHPCLKEAYELVATVEVVARLKEHKGTSTLRIEVVRSLFNPLNLATPGYQTRCLRLHEKADGQETWVTHDLAWSDAESAEAALEEALGFLAKQCVSAVPA